MKNSTNNTTTNNAKGGINMNKKNNRNRRVALQNTQKMDFHQAVEYTMTSIKNGYSALFVDTKFGMVAIELGRFFHDLVSVEDWRTCKATKFVINNRDLDDVKHVIRIKYNQQHPDLLKLQVVWGLSYTILCDVFGCNIRDTTWVNMLFQSYVSSNHMHCNAERYAALYIKAFNKAGMINASNYRMLKRSLTKNIEGYFRDNKRKLEDIQVKEIHHMDFGDEFHSDLMSIVVAYHNKTHIYQWEYNRDRYLNCIKCDNPLATIHGYDVIKKIIKDHDRNHKEI